MNFTDWQTRLWEPEFRMELFKLWLKSNQAQLVSDPVAYFSQYDNKSGTGFRECFSSTCAMIANSVDPTRVPTDDRWNELRAPHGDTTSVDAQLQTFKALGIDVEFRTNMNQQDLVRALGQGPVGVGYYHHGLSSAPVKSGGHWACAIGSNSTSLIVNDPAGEMDMKHGGNTGNSGEKCAYPWTDFMPRWSADGPSTGWGIVLK